MFCSATKATNGHHEQTYTPEVILKDLSFQVMAAVFEVHNVLGFVFLEKVYEKVLMKLSSTGETYLSRRRNH